MTGQVSRARLVAVAGVVPALALALMAIGEAAQPAAGAFRADRAALFQECAVLRNYEMGKDAEGRPAAILVKSVTKLTPDMQTGMNAVLDAWERRGDSDKRRLAFILATARRESQSTFRPLREAPRCGDDEECRERAIGALLASRAKEKGQTPRPNYALPDGDGRRYYGRGFIQLTFKDNYVRAGQKLGVDLASDPDKVMDSSTAADILVRAMLEGWYGSRRPLSFYLGDTAEDWLNARNNVNPHSPNKPVTAAYAKELVKCLRPAGGLLT